MMTMNLHTIVLQKESDFSPAFYWNDVLGKWTNEFQLGGGFYTKEEAITVLNKLGVFGATVITGKVS